MSIKKEELMQQALTARERAYAPYSEFKVGCALLTKDGKVYLGCNVENGAYGPTNCAERTALFSAIADGYTVGSFEAIAVVGATENPITPCGVCRQVLVELCDKDMPVYMGNLNGDTNQMTVSQLLPGAFTLED
ncbi:cytidine deaminase [Longirhabdus pacifica]|uniref:cytidine deaminase n=1 Tax=Longirhabdus pacifica TaxID=2305227 RepID=UPI00197E4E60|nr:cytidine deaminase [Longirhabdus pacifica]